MRTQLHRSGGPTHVVDLLKAQMAGTHLFAANDPSLAEAPQSRCLVCRVCGGHAIVVEDNGLCQSCRGLARMFAAATELRP